jgi:hypothetical protein
MVTPSSFHVTRARDDRALSVPVTRAFGDEAETQRAPGAIGRDVVEDLPLDAAAATVSIYRPPMAPPTAQS